MTNVRNDHNQGIDLKSVHTTSEWFARTHTNNKRAHTQADVSHSVLTDTCPLPNCRFMKSAGCECQAVSKRMPSSCRDSRSWPSCNSRWCHFPCSSGNHICASTTLTARAQWFKQSHNLTVRMGLLFWNPERKNVNFFFKTFPLYLMCFINKWSSICDLETKQLTSIPFKKSDVTHFLVLI